MKGLAGRLAILLALGLAAATGARASEIACPPNYQASTVRCVDGSSRYCARPLDRNAPGERLICEYAMLNVAYQDIYVEQQRRLRAGTLQTSDLMAWRRKRNACETVTCVDAVFAEWRRMAQSRPPVHAPLPLPLPRTVAAPERPAHAVPAHAVPAHAVPAPAASPAPLLADTSPPMRPDPPPVVPVKAEPVLLSASPTPVRPPARSFAPLAFAWLALPVAIVCTLAWALLHGRGRDPAPAPGRSLADRWHHLPHLAVVLGALVVLNGVLLVMVLAS